MRLVRVLLGIALLWSLGSTPAFASSELVAATLPSQHEKLSSPPGWVTVAFNVKIKDADAKLVVTNSHGDVVTTNELLIEETNLSIQLLPNLPKDTYTVEYRVRTSSGLAGGAYQFSYGPAHWTHLENSSWVGEQNQPSAMATTNEYGESTVAPTSSPSASATASAAPSASPTGSALPSASPSSVGPGESASPLPSSPEPGGGPGPWIALAVLALAVAGGGAWIVRRRSLATAKGRRLDQDGPTGEHSGEGDNPGS